MNIYALIILFTMILAFIFEFISEFLNVKNIKNNLPEEFEGFYSSDRYKLSQEYLKENTKFGWTNSAFSLTVTLLFWFLGGFQFLYTIISVWSNSYIIQGISYIGILIILNFIISLPFSLYDTFVIENKYGFNTTTAKTFILDILKGILIGILIGLPIISGILYILHEAGNFAWIYGWIGLTIFSIFLQFIYPNWIMPLFNKFTPLEDGELKDLINDFAKKVKFPLKKIFIMDGSKRSKKANAFFTGFGNNKRIVLFDTLIKEHTNEEIVAILAHEVGHYKKKHIRNGVLISILHSGVMFYLLSLFLNTQELYEAFYLKTMPIYAGLIFFSLLYSPIEHILSILLNIISRKNELEADRFAVESTNSGTNLITALKKLSIENLSNLNPHKFFVFLNYSHPPILERINVIRKLSNFAK